MTDKISNPPYTSYRSFERLITDLRDCEVLPHAIDRSFLHKRSGAEQSALIATLKWFGLIDENHVITARLKSLVAADDDDRKSMLKELVETSYPFVTDNAFDLQTATTALLVEQFRQYPISGSTLTKSISFFLAVAKDVGIPVSPFVKAPPSKNGGPRKKPKMPEIPTSDTSAGTKSTPRPPREGMVAIPIPIFGGVNGVVYLPGNMTESQWTNVIKMTEFILQNYRETMGTEALQSEGGES